MKTIKASEIGTYVYCQRAWAYQKKGVRSINSQHLSAGSVYHRQHTGKVRLSGFVRNSAYLLFVVSLTLAIIFIYTAIK